MALTSDSDGSGMGVVTKVLLAALLLILVEENVV